MFLECCSTTAPLIPRCPFIAVVTEDYSPDAFKVPNHERTSDMTVNSAEHKRRILSTNARKKEQHRRDANGPYRDAIEALGIGSLKNPRL